MSEYKAPLVIPILVYSPAAAQGAISSYSEQSKEGLLLQGAARVSSPSEEGLPWFRAGSGSSYRMEGTGQGNAG